MTLSLSQDGADGARTGLRADHPIRFLLIGIISVGPFTMSLYAPSMPAIVMAFDTDRAAVQTTLTVYLAAVCLGQLIYGPVSDAIGRRACICFGFTLFILASIACFLAPTVEALIAARVAQGLGASVGPVMTRAIVRDLFEKAAITRVLAFISMALATAPAFGPLLGGQIEEHFGWRWNFALLAVVGFMLLIMVLRLLPETNRSARPRNGTDGAHAARDPFAVLLKRAVTNYAMLITSRQYVGHLAPVACALGSIFTFYGAGPFILIDQMGVAPGQYGFFTVLTVSGYFFGSMLSNRLAEEVAGARMIGAGLSVMALALACLFLVIHLAPESPLLFIGCFTVWTFGSGLAVPSGISGAIQPFPHIAGAASALQGALQIGIGALGSLAISLLPGSLALLLAIWMAGLTALAATFFIGFVVLGPRMAAGKTSRAESKQTDHGPFPDNHP